MPSTKLGIAIYSAIVITGFGICCFLGMHLFWTVRDQAPNQANEKNLQDAKQPVNANRIEMERAQVQAHLGQLQGVQNQPGEPGMKSGPNVTSSPMDLKVLAQSRVRDLETQAKAVLDLLAKTDKHVANWDLRVKGLLTDDDGKKFVDNPMLVERFRALMENSRLSPDSVKALKAQVDGLVRHYSNANADGKPPQAPGEEIFKDLNRIDSAAKEALHVWESDSFLLETLLIDAKSNKPGDKSLEQALKEQKTDESRKRANAIAAARKAAFEEATKKIAEAAALAERQKGLIEAARIEDAAQTERLKNDAKLAAQAAKRERQQLEERYAKALPDIQSHLAAFIAPGYAQPRGTQIEVVEKKGPMSFGRLKASGVLLSGKPGLETIALLGSNFSNDRNKKNFPEYTGSDFSWRQLDKAFVQRAQDLLIEFGPLMVEKGLLAE